MPAFAGMTFSFFQVSSGMKVTAIILCGGESRRLGGIDKPLRPLLGRPLIEHVLDRLRPQVDKVILIANRNRETYAAYGHEVVDDGAYAGRGPLAGIAAGLVAAQTDWVLCVPGDAPLLPENLSTGLHQAIAAHNADLGLVHDGAGRQPLCSLLPRRLLPDLRTYLDGGGDAPRDWLAEYQVAEANFAHWPRWAWSLNTPEEWNTAESWLNQPPP
jgi:molybdopterin-guanine dinucleotide biosynthesis protein A